MVARTKAIAKKEVKQLVRDKRMIFVIFFFPVFLLGIFGYAVNFDVRNIQLVVLDRDNSEISRDFINSISSSSYFEIVKYISNDDEVAESLNKKEAQAILIIPTDFSKNLSSRRDAPKLQILIDGVDGNTAAIITNYINAAVFGFNQKYQNEVMSSYGRTVFTPIDFRPIFWFNPDLQTTKYLLPGLIALILIVTAVLTVSLSLVREKERGTIEQINVSSLSTIELLIGKALPYLTISLLNAVLIIIAGYLLFDIEIKGSYALLLLTTLVFLSSATAMGIFISVVSESQQVAFTLATFASLLPSLILSGFIFPIDGMPEVIQILTNITPAKFFIVALRAIMLRGVGLHAFWTQLIYLMIYTSVFLIAATVINKKKEAKT
ncbi:MAG: ABC transporter permease [Bacteroidetes bacterium]|nr:ABC transporter permease [Bacteroidota bacterium]MBU1677547.1 ABC transporter permease [Bacteroidota bacterium]MBU2505592.1 ABC transporter permease [Bacteroidota bacterium]